MSTRRLVFEVDLTPSDATDFSVLAAKFHLSDQQLAEALVRYSLSLAQAGGNGSGDSVEHFLDQKVSGHQALLDEIRGLVAKMTRAVRRQRLRLAS